MQEGDRKQLSRRGRRVGKRSLQFVRQNQNQKELVSFRRQGREAAGPRRLQSHNPTAVSLFGPLWDAVQPCVSTLWSFLPIGRNRARPTPLPPSLMPLLPAPPPPLPHPHPSPSTTNPRLCPQVAAVSLLVKAQPLPSWVFSGWASASSSSGRDNLTLRSQRSS